MRLSNIFLGLLHSGNLSKCCAQDIKCVSGGTNPNPKKNLKLLCRLSSAQKKWLNIIPSYWRDVGINTWLAANLMIWFSNWSNIQNDGWLLFMLYLHIISNDWRGVRVIQHAVTTVSPVTPGPIFVTKGRTSLMNTIIIHVVIFQYTFLRLTPKFKLF